MFFLPGKTYIKTIIREIRQSFSRFIAVFAIIALGVGFLAGLLATTPDMKISMDAYFDRTRMMDVFIKASMGLTGEDLKALENLTEVEALQGAYVSDALIETSGEETLTARIYGLPLDRIEEPGFLNRMELLAGRMPERNDECLVQEPGGFLIRLTPGTVLTILEDNTRYGLMDALNEVYGVTRFTVTGIVKSPLYVTTEREPSGVGNGRLGAVMYVPASAYTLPAYTDCYLTLRGAQGLTAFTPAYQNLADAAMASIKALGISRSLQRREEILAEARTRAAEKLRAGEMEYRLAGERTEKELGAARKKLDSGRAELEAGEKELAGAKAELIRGRETLAGERRRVEAELAEKEALLVRGEKEIQAAKEALAENGARLEAVKGEIEKTRASRFRMLFSKAREGVSQYDEGRAAYEGGLKRVAEKEEELQRGREALSRGRGQAEAELNRAEAELDAGEAELAAGFRRLGEARREWEAGERLYASNRLKAEKALRAGAEELEEARQQLDKIDLALPEWYVFDRNANVGCVTYKANAEKIDAVARVFPIFFLLVAALVALTTMTRMVEEERTQIGALKSLGYGKGAVLSKYLIYSGLTAILGSAAGMILGFQALPLIIYNAFGTMYHLPPLVTHFNRGFAITAGGSALLCTLGVTAAVCYHTLREKPAQLLLPHVPRAGKRIFLERLPFLWKRLSFTRKVTARNLIRYKKHFLMTVTGIAGCTALMLTGFGLRDSLINIAQTHFEEILNYKFRIELREGEIPDETLAGFLEKLGEQNPAQPLQGPALKGRNYLEIHREEGYVMNAGSGERERLAATLFIPREPDRLGQFITLRSRKTGTPLPFSASGALLTEKAAEMLKLQPGSVFTVENSSGIRKELVLSGISENYVGSALYLSPFIYADLFGGELSYETLWIQTGLKDATEQDRILEEVLSMDIAAGAEFTSQIQNSYNNLLQSISFVVLVLILAAGGLAMIVLYNLTNININERKRELATLRVLGFHQRETASYIFREITVLSITGAAAGLFLGIPLHRFVAGVAENQDLMFGRTIAPLSFILSTLITLFFSAAVDLLMLKKIRDIKMAESMKAAD
ncbi:MAG: FtsX-like permease family protein [Treponema sp.]|jgi:putative ABC transport system permease protein|nr:FtsX-like permease family protein [Treponema sp.]